MMIGMTGTSSATPGRGRTDDVNFGGPTRARCRLGAGRSCLASALLAAATLLAGAPDRATAADPTLELNQFWAGCELDSSTGGTVDKLLADIEASDDDQAPKDIAPNEIAFVIVYALNNDGDGQPATVGGKSGHTGPVLCLNTSVAGLTTTEQTADIPTSGTANFLDLEDMSLVRYELVGSGTKEKVLCHSTKSNVVCVRISPDL